MPADDSRPSSATQEPEVWADLIGWPNYRISTYGRVERCACLSVHGQRLKSKILKPWARGYYVTVYTKEHEEKFLNIARAMLETFVGPPPFKGAVARHLDDNVSNRNIKNLSWGTHKDNGEDAVRNGRSNKGRSKTQEELDKMSAAHIGKVLSEDHKMQIGAGVRRALAEGKGFKGHTYESKKKLSDALKLAHARKKGLI